MAERRSAAVERLGYRPSLDGVRGLAIALVVGYHYAALPPGGQVGVDLFFVLSGFLITTLLLEERSRSGTVSLTLFYARRARRLMPPLAVLLLAFAASTRFQHQEGLGTGLVGASYLGNAFIAYGSHFGPLLYHTHLSPLWSLAEEEQFYLLWPLLLLLVIRSKRPAWVLLLLIVGVASLRAGLALDGHSYTRIHYGPDTRSDGLLCGCLLSLAWRGGFRIREGAAQASVVIITAAAAVGWLVPGWAIWGLPLTYLGGVALVGAAVSDTELASAFAWRPAVWLGQRSYSLYLWHLMVLWLVGATWLRPLALVLALVVADASYRFVELPFRRLRTSSRSAAGADQLAATPAQ